MTTPWGPTGVSSATGRALSADTLEQIGYIVAPFADRAAVQAFLNSLNTLVKGYAAQKEVYEQSLPKTVRNNLAKAREAAQTLKDRIYALDGQSRMFIGQYEKDGLTVLRQNLEAIVMSLTAASQAAEELPSTPGRLMDHPKQTFCAFIAHAIRTDLNVEPTTTNDELFSQVLKIVIRFIEGREQEENYEPSVGQLMRKALKFKVIGGGPGQPAELIPPLT